MVGILSNQVNGGFSEEASSPRSPFPFAWLQRFPLDGVEDSTFTTDPLAALVYGLLAYRTVPSTARFAFDRLRSRYPIWDDLADAPLTEIEALVKATGFAHQRASFIQALVARMRDDFPDGSFIPLQSWDDATLESYLTSLPGVGTHLAQKVMFDVFDRMMMPLTQPLLRLFSRLGVGVDSPRLNRVLGAAVSQLTAAQRRHLYQELSRHARVICKAHFPRCGACHLTDLCIFYRQKRG